MDYKWVKMPKWNCFEIFELNTLIDRVFCGHSEYDKIIEIQATELKLLFKDFSLVHYMMNKIERNYCNKLKT